MNIADTTDQEYLVCFDVNGPGMRKFESIRVKTMDEAKAIVKKLHKILQEYAK